MKQAKLIAALCTLVLFLFSCQMAPNDGSDKIQEKTGTVALSYTNISKANTVESSKSTANIDPSTDQIRFMIISITDSTGALVADNKVLTVVKLQGELISEGFSLKTGTYKLTKFLVVDDQHNTLYAAPVAGSPLAIELGNKINPLPLEFTVSKDATTKVIPQVVPVTPDTPADTFGYAAFGLEIITPTPQEKVVKKETRLGNDVMNNITDTLITEYNEAGKKTVELVPSEPYASKRTFEYNAAGNLSKENYFDTMPPTGEPAGFYLKNYKMYEYNMDNKLVSIKTFVKDVMNPGQYAVSITYDYEYDASGNKVKEVYNNPSMSMDPTVTTYEYDANNRLVKEIVKEEINNESHITYEYDLNDNVLTIVEQNMGPAGSATTTTFIYNTEGRLVKAENLKISPPHTYPAYSDVDYEYNAEGKLVKETLFSPVMNSVSKIYTYTYEYF